MGCHHRFCSNFSLAPSLKVSLVSLIWQNKKMIFFCKVCTSDLDAMECLHILITASQPSSSIQLYSLHLLLPIKADEWRDYESDRGFHASPFAHHLSHQWLIKLKRSVSTTLSIHWMWQRVWVVDFGSFPLSSFPPTTLNMHIFLLIKCWT